MLYQVVSSAKIENLEEKVNALLKDGWRVQGGFCRSSGNDYQAMVKE